MTVKIIITAGGTGGHIFPALAVARELKAQGVEVIWIGSKDSMEERLINEFPFYAIGIKGLRGKGLKTLLQAPWRLTRALWEANKLLSRLQPKLVLGMGGFASGPTGFVAWLRRIPLIIHEQNSIAGVTNRILSRCASLSLQAFPNALSTKAITVGNPVRPEIAALTAPRERFAGRQGALRLLVLGGSLGAKFLNESVLELMKLLAVEQRPELWNQTGRGEDEALAKQYKTLNMVVRLSPFIENMSEAYEWADLVIARAGALTVTELAAAGVASILIPYPHAVDDHQFYNGQYLAKAGAAVVIPQAALQMPELLEWFRRLQDRTELLRMAESARTCAWPEATQTVAKECLKLIALPE